MKVKQLGLRKKSEIIKNQNGLSMLAWIFYMLLLTFIFFLCFSYLLKKHCTNNCIYYYRHL